MAEAIVSIVLGQLTSIIQQEMQQEVKLVVGVEKEVQKLTDNFQAIQAVLADAEQRQVKEKTTVRVWLDKLKDTAYDIEDVLDEWNTAMLKLQLEGIENTLVPKNKGKEELAKTTLAQFAYNDEKVKSNFDKRIWVCVSDPFDEQKIAKAILEALEGPLIMSVELNSLMEDICESIRGKRFFLVLDDVWTQDVKKWEPFRYCLKNGLPSSKILITTHKEPVAHMMDSVDIINILELSEEECWLLFKKIAFYGRSVDECEELEEIGREIVKKCKGLPLAAKIIGSLLRFKRSRKEWIDILNSEMWKIEDIKKGLLSPLLLSYNDLPYIIKRCFSYCTIFPKDHNINKDELIRLWMALGYLGLEQNMEMEIGGQEYFNYLVARSFFQDFEKDDNGNIIFCKMYDIVHDFAQFLTKNECFNPEVVDLEESFINLSHKKVLREMLMLYLRVPFSKSICNAKKLRSLLIYSVNSSGLSNLYGELTCLRTLDINNMFGKRNLIEEIPKEIEKLIHLRYLNLSYQIIKNLPDTICKLYNLQTLNLTSCNKLEELPQEMGKLLKLRHLINERTDSLSYMPIGIVRLACLRTLSEFVVSGSGGHDSKACCLEHLTDLNHLQGKLTIRGLANVANVAEIKRKQILKDKRNLCHLVIRFDRVGEGKRINEDDELVLEALQPPLDLKKLEILFYKGNAISTSWMTTLATLRNLELFVCKNCKHLCPLGKLPLLESVYVRMMNSVKRMGDEFWGIGIDDASSSFILFPKLKSLKFRFMENWEEWDYGTKRNGEEDDVKFMPCLTFLSFEVCKKLKALPEGLLQRTTLTNLEIYKSPLLEALYREETGEC